MSADELRRLPYMEYLRTDHWRRVREQALEWAEYRCAGCGADDRLRVHHLSYERRGREAREDLLVLCDACHRKAHPGKVREEWERRWRIRDVSMTSAQRERQREVQEQLEAEKEQERSRAEFYDDASSWWRLQTREWEDDYLDR